MTHAYIQNEKETKMEFYCEFYNLTIIQQYGINVSSRHGTLHKVILF